MLPENKQANRKCYTQRIKQQNGVAFSPAVLKGNTVEQGLRNSGGILLPA